MKMTITIQMDNAAFEDNQGGEVARILRELASKIDGDSSLEGVYYNLRDINGNKVGEMNIND